MKNTLVLCIIDGLGLGEDYEGNAFTRANTPFLDMMMSEYPFSRLSASGNKVGLPAGQMGNSEVGHLNIGAGRIVYTGLSLIENAINNGTFKSTKGFQEAFVHARNNTSTLHIMGLLSNGGVHALDEHLFLILESAFEFGLKQVSVHVFGDGRDVATKAILSSLTKLEEKCKNFGFVISSISGRYYSMDRDQMWDRTSLAFEALSGKCAKHFVSITEYVKSSYQQNITDEFLEPAINKNGVFLRDNDAVIFTNFRPDRARQLTHLLVKSALFSFKHSISFENLYVVSMMKYEGIETVVAFSEELVPLPLGEVLSNLGLSQLRVAETQKYAHVTYFFDGGRDINYKNSNRIMVDSLKVATYDLAPLMSAKKITDTIIKHLTKYNFILLNYANPDMVGHTGVYEATVAAVEHIDSELQRLKEACDANNAVLFITADHGNAETMLDNEGKPVTKHTTNDVFFLCSDKSVKLSNGILADVAPTILEYLQIKKPSLMSGKNLLRWNIQKERDLVKNSLGYNNNLWVYQDKSMFNYSVDTVLLGNFLSINSKVKNILEVGINNASLSIFIAQRKTNLKIDGVEILSRACEIGKINITENRLDDRIYIHCEDFIDFVKKHTQKQQKKYDAVVANPPFSTFNKNTQIPRSSFAKISATYEVNLSLEELIKSVTKVIKNKGYFAVVLPPSRIFDLCFLLKKNGFALKRIRMVFPRINQPPKFFLVESRYKAAEGVTFEPNLYLHPENKSSHEYKKEIKTLYKPKVN